jgi:hypothetical protein
MCELIMWTKWTKDRDREQEVCPYKWKVEQVLWELPAAKCLAGTYIFHILNSYYWFILLIHCRLSAPVFQGVLGSQGGKDHLGACHLLCQYETWMNAIYYLWITYMNYTYDFSMFIYCINSSWHTMKYLHELITWWNSNMK